jgi:hypothetical protein
MSKLAQAVQGNLSPGIGQSVYPSAPFAIVNGELAIRRCEAMYTC